MKTIWILVCLMGIGGASSLWAQEDELVIELDGAMRPESPFALETKPPSLLAPQVKPTRVMLPSTITPPPERTSGGKAQPILKVGYNLDAPPFLLGQANWERVQTCDPVSGRALSGWACRLELFSENAVGLRLCLQGKPETGIQMHIYDPNGEVVLPVRAHLDEEGKWWTPSLWHTQTIGLEVFIPEEATSPQLPEIIAIGYMFTGIEPDFVPAELGCHRDVTCFSGFSDVARAVARILFPEGSSNFVCTAQLMNRNPSDLAPIFSTAAHCINTQSSATGMEAFWAFQTSTCNGTPPSINTVPRTQGARLLKTHTGSDWTLLGLFEDPPGSNFFLGWTTSTSWDLGSTGAAVHHPDGTFKRISFYQRTFGVGSGCGLTFTLWDTEISLGNGTIEGGSSGSAGLDSDNRIRGICACAETDGSGDWRCPSSSNPLWVGWGKISDAFPNIRWYLFEMANPTFVNRGVSGDPGNEGNTERGTSANPFNGVHEATFCVPSGGTVRINPGNYNERFTIFRPMTLSRNGSSGLVQIGAP